MSELDRRLAQIQACLTLSATSLDLAEMRAHPEAYRLSQFTYMLAQHGMPQDPRDTAVLEASLQEALLFYTLADQRSYVFAQKAKDALLRNHATTAVIITGGYHTELLLKAFQESGISYCSVKMRRTLNESENPYFSLLTNPQGLLEKSLIPRAQHLAIPPFFAQTTNPQILVNEEGLSESMVRSYDFLELLLSGLTATNNFSPQSFDLAHFKDTYRRTLENYPAKQGHVGLDLEHVKVFPQALLIPLLYASPSPNAVPFLIIYPSVTRLALPSPISSLTLRENRLAFYPGAMRHDLEKRLQNHAWDKAWKTQLLRLRTLAQRTGQSLTLSSQALMRNAREHLRTFKGGILARLWPTLRPRSKINDTDTPDATHRRDFAPKGKTTLLPVFTELIGDLKLAAGLWPILERLSTHPPSWTWTAASFGIVLLVLGAGSVASNWLLAKKQHRSLTWQELKTVWNKEWTAYKQSWVKGFRDFWANRRFQPKASWFAIGLLILARTFDYATQFLTLNQLPMILLYSGVGVGLFLLGLTALRDSRKTAWFSEIINQSLRIIAAIVVVQMLKLPFAFVLLTAGASNVFAAQLNDSILKGLKKMVGVLSFAELFTSLRHWILTGHAHPAGAQLRTPEQAAPKTKLTLRHLLARLGTVLDPRNPVSQMFFLFVSANILFMNFYFALPLQVLLVMQMLMGAALWLQWLFIFKNVRIGQKVKMISLTGILPAALLSVFQTLLLLLSLAAAAFPHYLPLGIQQALASFQIPASIGELAGFIAMMYSLLGFSNIMKEQTKFEQGALPSEERQSAIQELVWERLEQGTPALRERLTPAEIQALKAPIRIKLFSNQGQPEWLTEFFQTGLHVYKDNVFVRRRIFNLLNDATLADLIFQKILMRKLSPENAEILARSLTRRDPKKDGMLLTTILQGGTEKEMEAAIRLMDQAAEDPSSEERARLQRAALEKRYNLTFPSAPGTYQIVFGSSWPRLNEKIKILLHYHIPVHPYFLRLSAARLQKLGRYLDATTRSKPLDYTSCRKLLENGAVDAYVNRWIRTGFVLSRTLPPVWRRQVEQYWLRHYPTGYLHFLVQTDPSPLARQLRDRRTTTGRAFAEWASAPQNTALTRQWLRTLLDALNQDTETTPMRTANILTFSRLSQGFALLESSPCGSWTSGAYARQKIFAPRLISELFSSGLRGTLTDILRPLPVSLELKLIPFPRQPRARWLDISA